MALAAKNLLQVGIALAILGVLAIGGFLVYGHFFTESLGATIRSVEIEDETVQLRLRLHDNDGVVENVTVKVYEGDEIVYSSVEQIDEGTWRWPLRHKFEPGNYSVKLMLCYTENGQLVETETFDEDHFIIE